MCDQHRLLGPSVLELVVFSRMERAVAVVEDFSPGAEVKMENFDLDQGALQKHPFLPMIRSSFRYLIVGGLMALLSPSTVRSPLFFVHSRLLLIAPRPLLCSSYDLS